MPTRCGLIPAAGKGSRIYPYSKHIPKCMLEINGIPNILRNILIMRDQLNVTEIFIVIGYQGEHIKRFLGDGRDYHVNIRYLENESLEKGFAYSIFLAKKHINDYFYVILSDECYINSNHHELVSFPYTDSLVTCGVMRVDDRELIRKNYSVSTSGEFIINLIEKPQRVTSDILGCGTFVLNPQIFDHLEEAFQESSTGAVDFIDFLNHLCQNRERIRHFNLTGTYVNINDRDSLHLAKYYERARIFQKQNVSLLIYSEGDEKDIAFSIKRYSELDCIDDIYVVLPYENVIEKDLLQTGVSIIRCPHDISLYGEKLKYAMERVPGDMIILAEADYSFPGRDVPKLLTYLQEADMVIGTRTTRQLIEQGSEMRGIVRMANIFLAKLLEVLWWNVDCRFSDVGCTFRGIWKSHFEKIKDRLNSRGPEFSVEMMIEAIRERQKVIEIPVNYFNRSRSMYKKYQNFGTFMRMMSLIVRKSLPFLFRSQG